MGAFQVTKTYSHTLTIPVPWWWVCSCSRAPSRYPCDEDVLADGFETFLDDL